MCSAEFNSAPSIFTEDVTQIMIYAHDAKYQVPGDETILWR